MRGFTDDPNSVIDLRYCLGFFDGKGILHPIFRVNGGNVNINPYLLE